jgi:prepilin peptidase CpaA
MHAKLRVKTDAPKASCIRDERGQDITEYALLIATPALGIETGISSVASSNRHRAEQGRKQARRLHQLTGGKPMEIQSTAWPVLTLLTIATVEDIRSRRIPNWLVLPFLAAGAAVNTSSHGLNGLGQSIGGIALAAAVTGVLCRLRGMGMGDLKLCTAVGAWIGPEQLGTALVVTGLAGGLLALVWATCRGSLRESLDGSSDLLAGFWTKGVRPHPRLTLDSHSARAIPYAPAIAIGTIFSFFST